MGVDLQDFLKDRVIGNVRSGGRGENDRPLKFNYFDVHIDKTTSEMAVEIFNQKYDKPKKLKIRFIKQNPMDIYLERYDGKRRRCFGNNKQAEFIDDNGKKQIIECNIDKCIYKRKKECKYKARLYFLIDGLENEGVWCYPIGSGEGITKICTRIVRANRLKEDLTKNWYELYLNEEDAPTKGKNYIPDIRKLEKIEEPTKSEENKQGSKPNYLKIKSFIITMFENQKVPKIKFINTEAQEIEFILLQESKQDILKLKPESVILPLKIKKTEKGMLLIDYKVIKAISDEIENKKAV